MRRCVRAARRGMPPALSARVHACSMHGRMHGQWQGQVHPIAACTPPGRHADAHRRATAPQPTALRLCPRCAHMPPWHMHACMAMPGRDDEGVAAAGTPRPLPAAAGPVVRPVLVRPPAKNGRYPCVPAAVQGGREAARQGARSHQGCGAQLSAPAPHATHSTSCHQHARRTRPTTGGVIPVVLPSGGRCHAMWQRGLLAIHCAVGTRRAARPSRGTVRRWADGAARSSLTPSPLPVEMLRLHTARSACYIRMTRLRCQASLIGRALHAACTDAYTHAHVAPASRARFSPGPVLAAINHTRASHASPLCIC